MKRNVLILLLAGLSFIASAKDGFKVTVKFTDSKDSMLYLAHYYGKPLPTIYKTDSARFDKNGVAVLQSNEPLLGGIYMVLLSDKKTYFEFLLNNGDDMTITATASKLPDGLTFKGSPENERFQDYIHFLKGFGEQQQKLMAELAAAKNSIDTAAVRAKGDKTQKEFKTYRRNFEEKYAGTMLANIFNALEIPEVPEGVHKLPNGQVDSNFAYDYYKAHFWDKFDFKDDRLINAPIYDAKLDEYFNKIVLQYPDSIEKEGDKLLAKTRGQKELFKYTLWWLSHNTEDSKIMGMDAAFVYFVENYFMKGDAYWLTPTELEKYEKRVQNIAPNVLGNVAPEITMNDINGKPTPLSSVKAKYTIVVFWTPGCGHCQKEIPKLDSVYKAVLKAKGVKIYAVRTEDNEKLWKTFIKDHHLEDWIHVSDDDHHSDYRSKYDVYSTPVLYLLDEKKIIRGKRFDYANIANLLEMVERDEKSKHSK